MTLISDPDQRKRAAKLFVEEFSRMEDKETAWKDLIKLTGHQKGSVRNRATGALGSVFQFVPDKEIAWKDLIKLTSV